MINKIMKIFGYVSISEILEKGSVVKKDYDKQKQVISKRIQNNYFTQDIVENTYIATEVLADNTIGEFIVDLVN